MELHSLETSDLLDMLSKHTADYTKMLADNNLNGEYEKCKLAIKALQAEIDARKKQHPEIDITSPPDFV
jgi:hypothetical protein